MMGMNWLKRILGQEKVVGEPEKIYDINTRLFAFKQDSPEWRDHNFYYDAACPGLIGDYLRFRLFVIRKILPGGTAFIDGFDDYIVQFRDDLKAAALANEPEAKDIWIKWYRGFYGHNVEEPSEFIEELYNLRGRVGKMVPFEIFVKTAKNYLQSEEYFKEQLSKG